MVRMRRGSSLGRAAFSALDGNALWRSDFGGGSKWTF